MLATLSSLRIKNLALVEDLQWNLSPGFIAVTGETGAGKSIIIGALKLLLGERADKTLIRTGSEACTVEAVFEVAEAGELNARLEEQGIEPCGDGQLILKRTFSASGTNRQFINGSPTTLAVLKSVGDALVDLHGPHDHQSLLSAESQLELLDSYAAAASERREYLLHYRRLAALRAEHAELSTSEAAIGQQIELLRHQIREIEGAALQPGEEVEIEARYKVAANSKRLIELSTQVAARLSGDDDSVLDRLAETQRLLRELEKTDPATAAHAREHETAVVALEELARSLERYGGQLDLDPARLAELEERTSLFRTLKRKYGTTIEDVIAFGEQAAARLRRIEGRGEELARLEKEIAVEEGALQKAGVALSKKRTAAAPKLAGAVQAHLHDLGFKKSGFEVQLALLPEPRAPGREAAEFLFSPNPGEPLKALRAIASSGEISRLMLAIKTALAAQDRVPLLVFDEIDANVGGEIAHAVGAKMRGLGEKHQVLCITHLPQVAATARTHFVVVKEFDATRTRTRLNAVEGKARIQEIARMLGGQTNSALAHARTLLEGL